MKKAPLGCSLALLKSELEKFFNPSGFCFLNLLMSLFRFLGYIMSCFFSWIRASPRS
jgi:hypothetical protein